jgi:hypothetical protein
MRYILIILVFLSVGANAQMVIKAHANYRPLGTTALFDNFTGAAAGYSLRKLRTAYTGSAIRVRKDTTGQPEQDIGFTASGDLDTTQLKQFLNLRSGFVTRWYDQSTNGFNGTQTTQANQPRIALTGVIERENGKPTIRFDGTNDNLTTTHVISYPFSTFTVSKRLTTATSAIIANNAVSNMSTTFWAIFTDNSLFRLRARELTDATIADNANLFLGYSSRVVNVAYVALNGSARNAATLNGVSIYSAVTVIGGIAFVGRIMNGFISEAIIYHSDQESNRTAIQNNINTYYVIY